MALESTTDLPAIDSLPVADPCIHAACADIALLADGLMVANDAPLLAIAISDPAAMPLLWNQRLSICARSTYATSETAMYSPVLDALRDAAGTLHQRLLDWGWAHADSEHLYALTDGVGVVLVTDQPLSSPGWLLEMARPGDHVPVTPLSSDGVWALIIGENHGAALH